MVLDRGKPHSHPRSRSCDVEQKSVPRAVQSAGRQGRLRVRPRRQGRRAQSRRAVRVAMSRENVEIVRGVYEGWARGDFTGGDAFHPDLRFEMPDWPEGTTAHGL